MSRVNSFSSRPAPLLAPGSVPPWPGSRTTTAHAAFRKARDGNSIAPMVSTASTGLITQFPAPFKTLRLRYTESPFTTTRRLSASKMTVAVRLR